MVEIEEVTVDGKSVIPDDIREELRALHKKGATSDLHARLKEFGYTKMGERLRYLKELGAEEDAQKDTEEKAKADGAAAAAAAAPAAAEPEPVPEPEPEPELPPRAKLKKEGNALFKAKMYAQSVETYSAALACDDDTDGGLSKSEEALLLSNRAMARLKMADEKGVATNAKRAAIEAALSDAQAAVAADGLYAKASYREAQALVQLGRFDDAVRVLHRLWRLVPGDAETHKMLEALDSGYARYVASLKKMREQTEAKRDNLSQMVHRSHPMSLRSAYYHTWMVRWTADDRETVLCESFMKTLEKLKEATSDEAREIAIADKRAGRVQFGENGWGVKKHKDEMANLITAEAFELSSVALEGLLNDTCYNNPEIYCQLVESVAEKREDEARFLTQDMKDKLAALRPQILMGLNCREHPLKEYMIYEMGLVLRKQVLIGVCIHTCMCAAGVMDIQHEAKHELRNLRRQQQGLPKVDKGEDSEDDEIMNKNDYEDYLQSQPTPARRAMALIRKRDLVAPGEDASKPADLSDEVV